jgi:hypothetical protein
MTESTKKNLLLASGVAVLILCLWLGAIFWAKSLYEKNKLMFQQVAKTADQQTYSTNLRDLVGKTEVDRTTLGSFFLTVDTQAAMMDQLDSTARDLGLSFDLRNAAEEGTTVKFDVQVEGAFNKVLGYLIKLDNWPYHSRLTGVKMEKNGSRWIGQAILEVYKPAYK